MHVIIWIVNIVLINFCLHFCSTPTCSWGAPVHTGTEEGAPELLKTCPEQRAQTWEGPGVLMATTPRAHQRCGFPNLGCFLPKSNSYKSPVFIISTVKISLLTAEAEGSLVGTWRCRVPHTAHSAGTDLQLLPQLQHVFPSHDGDCGLCYHSWHIYVIFPPNKSQLECENSLLFLS